MIAPHGAKIIRHTAACRCALCLKVDEIIAREGKIRARPGEPSEDYYVVHADNQRLAVWVPVRVQS
jgi:hypothetical protein